MNPVLLVGSETSEGEHDQGRRPEHTELTNWIQETLVTKKILVSQNPIFYENNVLAPKKSERRWREAWEGEPPIPLPTRDDV